MLRRIFRQVSLENTLFLRDKVVVAFHILLPITLLCLLTRVHANLLTVHLTIAVVAGDSPATTETFTRLLGDIPGFRAVAMSRERAEMSMAAGEVGAIVTLPGRTGSSEAVATVKIEGDASATALLAAVVPTIMDSVAGRPARIERKDVPTGVWGKNAPFTSVLLPGVVAMVIASVGLFGFGARLASYRERGFLSRLAVTPAGVRQFIVAQALHRVAFMVAQGILLVVVGRLFIGGAGSVHVGALLAMLLVGSLTFLAIGFLIAGAAKGGEEAAGWCHALFFPMLLLSGAFYPITALPDALRVLSPGLPMTYLLHGLQQSVGGGGHVLHDLVILACVGTSLLALSIRVFSPLPR
jgi:ABC-2 type transport system permease protein